MTATRIFVTLALIVTCGSSLRGDLTGGFSDLKSGRSYRDNLRHQLRDTLVDKYLGIGYSAKPILLRWAIDDAMRIRNDPGTSAADFGYAWYIANEGLEAMLYGYLSAGNRDLLKGTRLTFPNSLGYTENRGLPVGAFTNYWDDPVQSLYYAELYFLEGIKEALSYMQADPTGEIRAVDIGDSGLKDFPYYTRWNNPDYLPHPTFEDPAFNDADDQPSLTAAALLGKNVRRYGGTVTTISDKLWRAAFFNPNVANNREALLDEAAEHLRSHMHAQFLASLPLAATLNDGLASEPDDTGEPVLTRNEYQEVNADSVRINITAAQILAGRIARGERPKQIDLAPRWDRAAVNSRLVGLASLKTTTNNAWLDAEQAIQQNDAAMVSQAQDRLLRRDRYMFRLWQITGVHPDTDTFNHLNDEEGRQAYLLYVRDLVKARMQDFDAADSWFTEALSGHTDPAGVGVPIGVSEMGLATLRFMQALNEVKVAKARIDAIPAQIAIENNRNDTVNELITVQGVALTVLDVAVALASAIEISTTASVPPALTTTIKKAGFVKAALEVERSLIKVGTTVEINNANSAATCLNLLVEQGILIEQFPSSVIQAQLAVAEVKRLFAEVEQLVEDHEYHQDSTDSLWYNDPELVFEQEAAEKRYEDLVRSYQAGLYILAKMLEKAWVEPYENPVVNPSGSYEQIGDGDPRFALFPDAEAIFSVGNHDQSSDYWDALRIWNNYLIGHRGSLTGGRSGKIGDAIEISLRKHILGLNDLVYAGPPGEELFQVDTVLRHESIRKFRAYMLRLKEQAAEEGIEMRLEFPINLNQLIEVPGRTDPLYLFGSAGAMLPDIWNRRLIGVAIEVVGYNVTQGMYTKPDRFPVSLYLHGTISRESVFLDSIYTASHRTIHTDLALFQHDPLDLTVTGSDAIFAIDYLEATANGLQPDPGFALQMPVIEWPFACDNIVLLIRPDYADFHWENTDDLKIYLFWEAGPPVTTAANYAWPN